MRRKQLTTKEKYFVRDFVETRNATESAMRNYNLKNKTNGSKVAYTLMQRPLVQRAIEQALDKEGLGVEKVAEKLRELINANLITQYEGGASETSLPDYSARQKAVNSLIEILGLKAPEKHENLNANIDLALGKMTREQLLEELKRFQDSLVIKENV